MALRLAASLLLAAAFASSFAETDAYKILMFPFNNRSHLIEFHGLGRALLSRGHEVHIFLARADPPPSEVAKAGYKFIHPSTNKSIIPIQMQEELVIDQVNMPFIEQMMRSREGFDELTRLVQENARLVIGDQSLFQEISDQKYDFMVLDSVLFDTHIQAIPYKLGIPYGGLTAVHEAFLYRMPNFPSAFPDIFFSNALFVEQDQLGSSMWERFKNLIAVFFHEWWAVGWADEHLKLHNVTEYELRKNLAPHLIDQHPILSDPLVTLPGVHMVGGLATRPARPITDPQILAFIQSSDAPLIVCSFGTLMEYLTPALKAKLFNAFRRVPQYRVIMRLKGDTQDKPDNVMAVGWLPQNDLLGHNKTALFITHSGNNGQNEALYHAVPMVAFFIFGDQLYNAGRVARRGYGVQLNLLSFTEDELVAAIEQVLTDKSYAQRIGVASEIFRLQNPGQVGAEVIENAIKYGTEHLRNDEAFDMTIVEYLMLDVVFIVYTIALVVGYVTYLLLRKLLKFTLRIILSQVDVSLQLNHSNGSSEKVL